MSPVKFQKEFRVIIIKLRLVVLYNKSIQFRNGYWPNRISSINASAHEYADQSACLIYAHNFILKNHKTFQYRPSDVCVLTTVFYGLTYVGRNLIVFEN